MAKGLRSRLLHLLADGTHQRSVDAGLLALGALL
jgi:hypothetical protein